MQAYKSEQVKEELAKVENWQQNKENGEIYREFKFENFVKALDFVNKIGEIAEAQGHHPDITIKYNRVLLSVITHDADGLTEKDFFLARQANELV